MGLTLSRIYSLASVNIEEGKLEGLDIYARHIAAEFDSLSQITTTANILALDEEITEEEMYGLLLSNVAGCGRKFTD